jgi:transcriptional regulator with XRE-family HTH domain
MLDVRREIREFLISRRARVTPENVGLPTYGARRVPGLRREEVAVLAGISAPYYARLERGDVAKASSGVLEALARALLLNDAEREHLFDLVRAANPMTPLRDYNMPPQPVRPAIQQLLDAFTGAAAFVSNDRLDILAGNSLGYALCSAVFADGAHRANLARFMFLDPAAPEFMVEWDNAASDAVAALRSSAGRNPDDQQLSMLISELASCSEAFRVLWAEHDVMLYPHGVKTLKHPLVGELRLNYEQLDLPQDPRLAIFTFSAPAGTPEAESLNFLASWSSEDPQREGPPARNV